MYLLYLDASGSVRNPNERHFILAGIAVFERQIYHLINQVDRFVSSLDRGEVHDVELHGSVMANGRRSPWKGMTRQGRLNTIERALHLLRDAHGGVTAFAVAVDKCAVSPDDPFEYAFEEICNRFDLFLSRLWSKRKNEKHRGLVVMDKSHYEETLQGLARRFREEGTRWRALRNLAEVPMFLDSAASRLIQIADLFGWAVWRRYEYHDTRHFDQVVRCFDTEGGVMHGLVHRRVSIDDCHCPACLSRLLREQNTTASGPSH